MFEIRSGVAQSRYVNASANDVLIRLSAAPHLTTIGGYLVLSPEQAESLSIELHHWLETKEGR
jgi:hypothetical protein